MSFDPSSAYRTLVIQPLLGIGDMVWHLPLLRAIARQAPQKKITLLCKASSQSALLFKECEFIEDIMTLPPASTPNFWALVTQLRKSSFKQAWVLHHSKRYYMLTFFARIQERYGYGFRWQKMWLTDHQTLTNDQRQLSTLDRIAAYLATQEFEVNPQHQFFKVSKKRQDDLIQKFSQFPRPWISFGIGATESSRRWPLENFAHLAKELSKGENKTIFLCCSSAEQEKAQSIMNLIDATKASILPITNLPLDEVTALLSLSSLFIGNDSGLMNISATLGIPTVGLFGPNPPHTYVPNLYGVTPNTDNSSADNLMATITPSMVLSFLAEKQLLAV